jgi:hypothetical protein
MQFTYQEARLVDDTRRHVGLWRKGVFTGTEIVGRLVDRLVDEGTDRIIAYCVAALPDELRSRLADHIGKLTAIGYRGKFFHFGPGMSAATQEQPTPRFRAVVDGIQQFLAEIEQRPASLDEAANVHIDVFWAFLRSLSTAGNPPCKWAGCSELSINASIYCARHHYTQIEHKAPEDLPSPRLPPLEASQTPTGKEM